MSRKTAKTVKTIRFIFLRRISGNQKLKKVVEVLRSGWITTGPQAKLFETKLPNTAVQAGRSV